VHQAVFADDAETLAVLRQGGFDQAEDVLAVRDGLAGDLDAVIDAAVAAGVFGVPSFKVGDALFFGNDRLNFLAEELAR
jgi:2-hydroxychromene-2-carboxylate isomerase